VAISGPLLEGPKLMPQSQTHLEPIQFNQTESRLTRFRSQNSSVGVGATASVVPAMSCPLARGGLPPRTLRLIREYIETNLEKDVCLDELAGLANLSKCHFARAFKQSAGLPPHAYLINRRVDRARELLSDMSLPLAEVALATGFSNQSHFTRRFREQMGMTPSSYRWNLP
jgi:transcriptional regulator GlxA family with amidase domain